MKNIFTTCFFSLMIINSFGQVSIGSVLKPDINVILDLTNFGSKGLLLPKTNTPPTSPPGNIVFDTSYNMISYADKSGVVNYLSPWKADLNKDVTYSDTGKIIINYTGSYPDKVILEVQDGSVKVNNGDVNVTNGKIKEEGNALLPTGVIVMFSGTTAPPGWVLCDGSSASNLLGAPDLKGRFIVGYDPSNADYNTIGNRGGSDTMSHTHDVDPLNRTTTAGGAHSHNGITAGPVGSRSVGNNQSGSGTTVPNTAHTHIINDEPDHTHDLDIPNFTSDTASNNENRPPYWTLAFIMKK